MNNTNNTIKYFKLSREGLVIVCEVTPISKIHKWRYLKADSTYYDGDIKKWQFPATGLNALYINTLTRHGWEEITHKEMVIELI